MKYSLSNIRDEILIHKLKQVLESGENSMFDNKLDRDKMRAEVERLEKIYNEEKE